MPNVSFCEDTPNEVHYNPTFFCKLTLNDDSVVDIEGSGELTSAMTSPYSASCVSAEIGELCTSIGDGGFINCSGLTNIVIPNGVTSIGGAAFGSCNALTSITIPNSVTSIGHAAFGGCKSLTSIEIPNSVTSIGSNPSIIASCTNLEEITFNAKCGITDGFAHYGTPKVKKVIIGDDVLSIGASAFTNTSLTNVTIGNGVTSIGTAAFAMCSGLTSATIPNSVTSIGSAAFGGCSNLTSVTIGSGVTSFGDTAFGGCTSLSSVTVEATTPPTLGRSVFDGNASGRKIYVPSSSVDAYKAASNWSTYASDILPIQ